MMVALPAIGLAWLGMTRGDAWDPQNGVIFASMFLGALTYTGRHIAGIGEPVCLDVSFPSEVIGTHPGGDVWHWQT